METHENIAQLHKNPQQVDEVLGLKIRLICGRLRADLVASLEDFNQTSSPPTSAVSEQSVNIHLL